MRHNRPIDVVGNAVHVFRIEMGEIEGEGQCTEAKPYPDRANGGRICGQAQASGLSPKRRSEIAKVAANARWDG